MLNFPMPYEHELIYSMVARAGIRLALTSPKQLLDEVFNNRKVIATFDLPCHLSKILQQLSPIRFDIETLIYQHTLFPIYAPFVPETRRQQCLQWMAGISQGSVHLALGVNASRLETLTKMRYCPQCLSEQLAEYGEWSWSRLWQVQGANCCIRHGQLLEARYDLRSAHRHEFIAPTSIICPNGLQPHANHNDLLITEKVLQLFSLPCSVSPNYEQWTMFYKQLAQRSDCIRGQQHIDHENVQEKIKARWSHAFLSQYNLHDIKSETGWLQGIFRKHRKSFSYLEHLLVIEALTDSTWTFQSILEQVKSFSTRTTIKVLNTQRTGEPFGQHSEEKRQLWLTALQQLGIEPARKTHGATYAWLYRHDQNWLIATNRIYHHKYIPQGTRIDWCKRDLSYVKQLIKLNISLAWDLDTPRRSAKWWMKQINAASTIEKNLHALPLVQEFLQRYSEDVSCHQIRRLSKVFIEMTINRDTFPRWIILRKAGLSDERMTDETMRFLSQALPNN